MRVQPTNELEEPHQPETSEPRLASTTKFASVRTSSIDFVDEIVVLSPRSWAVLWTTVLLVIVSNAIVLGVFAKVYSQSDLADSFLWFLRNFFVVSEVNAFLAQCGPRIALGYAVLSVIYTVIAIRMVIRAILWSRHLRKRTQLLHNSSRFSSITRTHSAFKQSAVFCPDQFRRMINRWRRAIGVRGEFFDLRLLVEEWLELTTQTIAAHSASRSITNAPLNLTYAVIIFANGISTVVTARAFPQSLVKQRLACIMVDLLLDFLWGTLLPVWMYVPVVRLYADRSHVLDDLTSFSGLTRQAQRILVVSWRSYAMSIIPFCSSLLKLLDLQDILRELIPNRVEGRLSSRKLFHVGRRTGGVWSRLAHILMPVYGLAVLLTSLAANEVFNTVPKQTSIQCGYRVHPWFSTKEACLQRRINCTTLETTGDAGNVSQMLVSFDESTLAELHFLGCSGLEMPRDIHRFPNLMSIVIIHSRVLQWGQNAEITDKHFHDIRNVQLYSVEFVENPVGFTGLDRPLAATLEWIHMNSVDGNRLLSLVGDHWRRLQAFACERCGLTEFPVMFYEFTRLEVFSIVYNDVPSIPDDWLGRHGLHLQMLWLDGNLRLTELPDSLWRQAAWCGVFSVGYTNLSVVPDWVGAVAYPGFKATVIGTPLCAEGGVLPPAVQAITSCMKAF